MRALTLWQPWAWLVATGLKPIENRPWRPWPSAIGEEIAIHAGSVFDDDAEREVLAGRFKHLVPKYDHAAARTRGAIIGTARVVGSFTRMGQSAVDAALAAERLGVDTQSHFDWAFGPECWVLRGAVVIEPVPCRGALALWRVPEDLERVVLARVAARGRAA